MSGARPPSRRSAPAPPVLSPARRRAFFLVTVAVPLAFFALLEGVLRLSGYGPDLSLFTTEVMAGRTYHVMNHAVKGRYFVRVPFNPSTSPDFFAVPKPEGTFRIFCLGGSTTVGYPYWYNGSFSTFLRDRLRRLFPERKFEIINMGMTATNSFTVIDMARELVDYEPDLFIVYDGHNEFYGALGVASKESFGRARWLTMLSLRAVHWKTFVLLRSLVAGALALAESDAAEPGFTMMERLASGQRVPYGSDLYRAGLEVYRENLSELKTLTARHSIPVILGNQVSNLRDLSPFISERGRDIDPATAGKFDSLLADGKALLAAGLWSAAAETIRAAIRLDSMHAGVHFLLGRALEAVGMANRADAEYVKARDLDALRFRQGSEFNETLRSACDTASFRLADMEEVFRRASPGRLIGSELIVEHLHPNSRGFFLMAAEYAGMMRRMGLVAPAAEWERRDTIPDAILWAERSITGLDEMMARRRTEVLTSGWPFRQGMPLVDPIAPDDTLGGIVEHVMHGEWNWLEAHTAAAEYFMRRGEAEKAADEYRVIVNQLPLYDISPWLALARLQIGGGQLEEARRSLLGSLDIRPTILAYRALGDIALRTGRPEEAVRWYDRTFGFPQSPAERVDNGYLLSLALSRSGDLTRAATEVMKVLAIRPDHQQAVELLNRIKGARQE